MHVRNVLLLLAFACALRLALFSGFVLGDDPAYGELVHQILTTGYPRASGLEVFPTRPILLGITAASVRLFGYNEFAFVLPVLLSALAGITAVYGLGVIAGGTAAGICSALTLALFPLDVVYSTTFANDIVASGLAAMGALLIACSHHMSGARSTRATILALLGGLLTGLCAAVKLSMVLLCLPLAIIVGVLFFHGALSPARTFAILGGWVAAQLLIGLFFRISAGDWLAAYRIEWAFNHTNMLPIYLSRRREALLAYPRWAFSLRPEGGIHHRFFPYGLFFHLTALAAVAGLWWSRRRVWYLAVWCLGLALILEFWPLQLFPQYVPIHRLPRFIHPVAIPAAVMIGVALREALRRGVLTGALGVVIWVAYAWTSLDASVTAALHHRDVMLDQRFAASLALPYVGPIVADEELLNFFRFRAGYENVGRFVPMSTTRLFVPERALVVVGGSRRIDLDPSYVAAYQPVTIPPSWLTIAPLPGQVSPFRRAPGRIYIETAGPSRPDTRNPSMKPAQLAAGCAPSTEWVLRDVIDVGDAQSESAHEYSIEAPTWSGQRQMLETGGDTVVDDGRAFRGAQHFMVRALEPGVAACVAIRIDAHIAHQVSRWSIDGRQVAVADTGTLAAAGHWRVKGINIAAPFVTGRQLRLTETFISSDVDLNSFRVEVYQPSSTRP